MAAKQVHPYVALDGNEPPEGFTDFGPNTELVQGDEAIPPPYAAHTGSIRDDYADWEQDQRQQEPEPLESLTHPLDASDDALNAVSTEDVTEVQLSNDDAFFLGDSDPKD